MPYKVEYIIEKHKTAKNKVYAVKLNKNFMK